MIPEYIQRTKNAEFKKSKIMEATFFDEAKERGYDIKKAKPYDDMYKHIDFYLQKEDQSFSVDVKGRKKIHRKSNSFDDIHTWVEFKNVRGNPGWLYGDADYIVFEQESRYVFINRKELLDYCLDTVEDVHVTSPLEATYKYYTRNARKDLLSRIKLTDAIESKFFSKTPMIWEKPNDESSN